MSDTTAICGICGQRKPCHHIRIKSVGCHHSPSFIKRRYSLVIITSDGMFPYCKECHTSVSKWRKIRAVISFVISWMMWQWSRPNLRWRIIGKGNAHYCWCIWKGLISIAAVLYGG